MAHSVRSAASWLRRTGEWLGLASPPGARTARRPWRPVLELLEDRCLLSTLQAISLPPGNQPPSATAAGASDSPSVSADGNYVAFESTAPNLVGPGQTGAPDVENVYLLNRSTGQTVLVSHLPGAPTAAPTSGFPSYSPIISQNGQYVLYGSEAPEFAPGLSSSGSVVVLYNVLTGQNTLVSHSSGSPTTPAAGVSEPDAISANGRYALFTDQVTPDSPTELLLFDGATGNIQLVYHAAGQDTVVDDGGVNTGFIGQDGKVVYAKVGTASVTNNGLVAYVDSSGMPDGSSDPDDPVSGFFGTGTDVYLYNAATQTNQLVSFVPGSPTEGAGGTAFGAAISADGSTVVYTSGDYVAPGQSGPQNDNVFVYNVSAGVNTLISGSDGSATVGGDANSGAGGISLAVSGNGQFVAFTSDATDLIPGQTGAPDNVFLYNGQSQSLALLSFVPGHPTEGAGGVPDLFPSMTPPLNPGPPAGPSDPITAAEDLGGPEVLSMSNDGSLVAYVSTAGDVVSGQTGAAGTDNVFLYARATGQNALVGGANGSATATAALESSYPVLSGDGNLLAFHSLANNLLPATQFDGNGVADVFTYRPGGSGVALVSAAAFPDPEAPGDSFSSSVSADGTYTVFLSNATNLVPNQVTVNSQQNVFLYDKLTGTITLVNHAPGALNTTGDGGVHPDFFPSTNLDTRLPAYVQPVISADGSTIAFASFDDNLVSGEDIPPGEHDQSTEPGPVKEFIYLYHVTGPLQGTITLVNHAPGQPATVQAPSANGVFYDSFQPSISANGQFVAFAFGQPSDDGVGVALYSQASNSTTILDSYADQFNTVPRNPVISDNGQFVVYDSGSNGSAVSVYNGSSGTITLVASSGDGAVISHDGSTIAFASTASNLVSGQTSSGAAGLSNVFLYNVASGAVTLVSGSDGSASVGGDGNSDSPAVSNNVSPASGGAGYSVAFRSDANNLLAGQSGPTGNIFEFITLPTSSLTLVSHQAGSPTVGAGGSSDPVIDDDGHLVSYVSTAGDLIPGQSGTPGVENVFVWLRQTAANILASGQDGSPTVGGNADSDFPLLTRDSFPGFSSTASNLVNGVGGFSVAYINTLVSLTLSPNTVADGSPAGTIVGGLTINSLLFGSFVPPVFSPLNAGEGNNADFALAAPGGVETLVAGFTADYAAQSGYTVDITVDVGFGLDAVALPVFVDPPAPPAQMQVNLPTAAAFVLNADGSLVEQRPAALGGPLLLSPAGTILAVSAVATGSADAVFAVTAGGNNLWEYTSGWSEVSGGYFGQISAAADKSGNPVVFGVLGEFSPLPNSLWELTAAGWAELSQTGTILSVSAVSTKSGEAVFAIVADSSLWEHTSAGWSQASGGSFLQVSAGLNASGQATAYAVVTDNSLWEFNPATPGLWTLLSQSGTILSVSAGAADTLFAVTADQSLWRHGDAGWAELSAAPFTQANGSATATGDAVFAVLADSSLWENTDAGWLEILTADVNAAAAAP